MDRSKWEEFDRRLAHSLSQIPHTIERISHSLGAHYNRMTKCIQDTIKDTVPPKKPLRYNGRKVSAETKRLYDLRERDFVSGRKIEKSDHDAWNRTLSKAAMKDFKQWVESRSTRMEIADEQGDIRVVHQGAKALAGKSKSFASKQPTKKDKGKGEVIQSEQELGDL